MPNPVVRWQIVSPDAEGTAAFYRSLFRWTVTRANALGYREMSSGEDRGADGGVWPAPAGQQGFVQMFVEVDDIPACITEATRLGARVIVPATVLPDGDSMAVLADPTGITFGICTLRAPRGVSAARRSE